MVLGAFDAETLGAFGNGVAAGRRATESIDAVPALQEVDCASVARRQAVRGREGGTAARATSDGASRGGGGEGAAGSVSNRRRGGLGVQLAAA